MSVPYRTPGVRLALGTSAPAAATGALQRDLRRLGYLASGLDGRFGPETARAVRALQIDLLAQDARGRDGRAPVAVRDFNRGRVADVTGVVDEPTAACLEDLGNAGDVPKLPRSDDPADANRRALETVRALTGLPVPLPFLLAILAQESRLQHFRVPSATDPDDYIVVGLDRNDPMRPDRITSRGYGIGQFTLFHHPPRPEEVESVMLDPGRNIARAVHELREKFDGFIVGASPGTRADDRIAEVGAAIGLRACRYTPGEANFQADCRACARAVPPVTRRAGDPLFGGARDVLAPTKYHARTVYDGNPDRAAFACDWPYAVRRYNGSGVNSYHYQAQVLERLRG